MGYAWMMRNIKHRQLYGHLVNAFIILALTILLYYLINRTWVWNLNIPFDFGGDTLTDGGTLTLAKKAIQGDGIISLKGFWTADDASNVWTIIDSSMHFVLMKFLAIFIHVPGLLANIYFILTFPLCAWFMYYALIRLRIHPYVSICVSVLYTFLPGHLFRGLGHLSIGSCFALPLMALGCVYVLNGELFSESAGKDGPNLRIQSFNFKADRKLVEGFIGSIFVGFLSIYMGFFCMIVHAVIMFLAFFNHSSNRKNFFGAFIFLIADFLAAFFTTILPTLLSAGTAVTQFSASRNRTDLDIYALKLSQLVLPIQDHRFNIFSKIRALFSSYFPESESATSSLGLIISIAFIISLILVFINIPDKKIFKIIQAIGKLNLILLLIGTIGGVNAIIGLAFYFIRCYNRLSFIIAAFSCIALAYFFQFFLEKIKFKFSIIILAGLVCIGAYDQTEANFAVSQGTADYFENIWNQEELFFTQVENREPADATILVYPSKYSSLFKADDVIKYEQMKCYIHSRTAKYSVGYGEGSYTANWIQALDDYSTGEKIRIAIAAGFHGIMIQKTGFNNILVFEQLLSEFTNILGPQSLIVSADDQWYYFSFDEYKANLPPYDFDRLKEFSLEHLSTARAFVFDKTYKFGTSEIESYLVQGFSWAEEDFRWSLGPTSTLSTRFNAASYGDLQVELEYFTSFGPQQVSISGNGQILGEWTVSGPGKISFTVPRSLIVENKLDLIIYYSSPTSPASQGASTDNRELAVAYGSMIIHDTGVNTIANDNGDIDQITYFIDYINGGGN